jgi:hypothetical protein
MRTALFCAAALAALMPVCVRAQEKSPPVRVNVLNVCTPSAEEQKEIAAALERIPAQAKWGDDFEVARGRTNLSAGAVRMERGTTSPPVSSSWARIRREFTPDTPWANVQYSFSVDAESMVETLVFRMREPKDLLQVSLEDNMSAVTTPAAALATNTPAERVKLERFGKASVVLARCTAASAGRAVDQSAYESLFSSASRVLANYRDLLNARRTIPEELARVPGGRGSKPGHDRQR